MLDELRPLGLADAARDLGVDPFEVVRLLVIAEAVPDRMALTADHIEKARETGGIEEWYGDGDGLPEDDNAKRRVIRGALGKMVDGGYVGETTTRMDNVWRGIDADGQLVLQQMVSQLVSEGHLLTAASQKGVQISLNPESMDVVTKVVEGKKAPVDLSPLAGVMDGS